MLSHGLLSILLHAGVDGGMNSQTIRIDTIGATILLSVLITPSIKRIGLPINGIDMELHIVPRRIIASVRFFRHHITTQEVTKIHGNALLMVGNMELQRKWFGGIGFIFCFCNISGLHHLMQYHITTFLGTFRIADRIIIGRILA